MEALDRAKQTLGDRILAVDRGQQRAHWTRIDGVADDAAAHAGLGLDEVLCRSSHAKEPVPEQSRLRSREVPVVRQLEDLVQHVKAEPACLDEHPSMISQDHGRVCLRGHRYVIRTSLSALSFNCLQSLFGRIAWPNGPILVASYLLSTRTSACVKWDPMSCTHQSGFAMIAA